MRKLIILATAIAAFAAFALPASASAEATSNWVMGGEELAEEGTMVISGHVEYTGGTTCTNTRVHAILTPHSGDGHITEFECIEPKLTETLASVCSEVTAVNAEINETYTWTATDEGNRIKIENIMITNHYKGSLFCPGTVTIEDDTAAGGGVFITPENTAEMSTGELSGTVETDFGTQEVHGEGEVTVNSGTYGL